MKKMILTDEYLKTLTPVEFNETSCLFKTKDGEFVKLFTPIVLEMYYNIAHVNLEAKLLNKEKFFITEEIIKPNTIYYSRNGMAVGYKMRAAKGIDFNKFDTTLSQNEQLNLARFNNIHKKLETIVKNNKDIIFPDLCTCDNIYIGPNDNLELIDYDGMQIGKHQAIAMSTTLNDRSNNYYIPKYWQRKLFTKNLDKKSLILLYFLSAFHVDLNKVGAINPYNKRRVTLEETFYIMGLQDYEIYEKVSKLFNDNVDNVYLEDSIDKLEKDYKLVPHKVGPNVYMKRLEKR